MTKKLIRSDLVKRTLRLLGLLVILFGLIVMVSMTRAANLPKQSDMKRSFHSIQTLEIEPCQVDSFQGGEKFSNLNPERSEQSDRVRDINLKVINKVL